MPSRPRSTCMPRRRVRSCGEAAATHGHHPDREQREQRVAHQDLRHGVGRAQPLHRRVHQAEQAERERAEAEARGGERARPLLQLSIEQRRRRSWQVRVRRPRWPNQSCDLRAPEASALRRESAWLPCRLCVTPRPASPAATAADRARGSGETRSAPTSCCATHSRKSGWSNSRYSAMRHSASCGCSRSTSPGVLQCRDT